MNKWLILLTTYTATPSSKKHVLGGGIHSLPCIRAGGIPCITIPDTDVAFPSIPDPMEDGTGWKQTASTQLGTLGTIIIAKST